MLFDKEDEVRVQEFIAELRSMNLTVEGMVEDYDRLIALYDISFFFRIYLRSCAQALHDRVFTETQSSLSAGRYIQFFETELTTMPRMIYLFQSAYGSRFVRSVYQASYLTFIERQQQATNFLKKCVAEHDKFTFFRKTIATIEDNHLIEEPKVLNPRIKGRPHNRPISETNRESDAETHTESQAESQAESQIESQAEPYADQASTEQRSDRPSPLPRHRLTGPKDDSAQTRRQDRALNKRLTKRPDMSFNKHLSSAPNRNRHLEFDDVLDEEKFPDDDDFLRNDVDFKL